MRNELSAIRLIEQYLSGELSQSDRMEFEQRMASSEQLRADVALQEQVMGGIERSAMRAQIAKAGMTYNWLKNGLRGGLGAVAVGLGLWGATTIAGSQPETSNLRTDSEGAVWVDTLSNETDFLLDNSKDTVIESNGGIIIGVPAGAFIRPDGSVAENVELHVTEALEAYDIIRLGLSTHSGEDELETGGMFEIKATENGQELSIAEGKALDVNVPTDKVKPDMKLWDGIVRADGTIDWQNPKPLKNYLNTVDIFSLDFLPQEYRAEMARRGYSDSAFVDSLYYSFASDFNGAVGSDGNPFQLPQNDLCALFQAEFDYLVSTMPCLEQCRAFQQIEIARNRIRELVSILDSIRATNTCTRGLTREELDLAGYPKSTALSSVGWSQELVRKLSAMPNCRPMFKGYLMNGLDEYCSQVVEDQVEPESPEEEMPASVDEVILWSTYSDKVGSDLYRIVFSVEQRDGWHIYSQEQTTGGTYVPTSFTFEPSSSYELVGAMKEPATRVSDYEGFPERAFQGSSVQFTQLVRPLKDGTIEVPVSVEFMACKTACFPPTTRTFRVPLEGVVWTASSAVAEDAAAHVAVDTAVMVDEAMLGINPASVKAMYDERFQGTLLATREFEERMHAVHPTCQQPLLDLYVANLDRPLYEIDSMASRRFAPHFRKFMDQRQGRVRGGTPMAEKLNAYFKKRSGEISRFERKVRQRYLQKVEKLKARKRESEEELSGILSKEWERQAAMVARELEFNMRDVKRVRQSFAQGSVPPAYYSASITTTGFKNVDRAVAEATITRNSANIYYDKYGKVVPKGTAGANRKTLVYEKLDIQIEGISPEKCFVYLVPDRITGFYRAERKGSSFQYKLNGDMTHRVVVYGEDAGKVFYAERSALPSGKMTVRAFETDAEEVKRRMRRFNHKEEMGREIAVRADIAVLTAKVNKHQDKETLRAEMKAFVFPCATLGFILIEEAPGVTDSTANE